MRHAIAILLLSLALPAGAQTAKKPAFAPGSAEALARERCRANRGTDCDSREGLREWMREDRPLTPEQQQAAAAARRHRQECARSRHKPGC